MADEEQTLVWHEAEGVRRPATLSLSPGIRVYGERIFQKGGSEYRVWDPFRSKLAAALIKGLHSIPIKKGCQVLYLGVSTGTTASHISDLIGEDGVLYGVEFSARVAREFVEHVARHRLNVVPIVEDARFPERYAFVYSKVDLVYADIAQQDQTQIAIDNCQRFLRSQGFLILIVKSPSIDVTKKAEDVLRGELVKLEAAGFAILQHVGLEPFDTDHWIVLAQNKT